MFHQQDTTYFDSPFDLGRLAYLHTWPTWLCFSFAGILCLWGNCRSTYDDRSEWKIKGFNSFLPASALCILICDSFFKKNLLNHVITLFSSLLIVTGILLCTFHNKRGFQQGYKRKIWIHGKRNWIVICLPLLSFLLHFLKDDSQSCFPVC